MKTIDTDSQSYQRFVRSFSGLPPVQKESTANQEGESTPSTPSRERFLQSFSSLPPTPPKASLSNKTAEVSRKKDRLFERTFGD